MGNIICDIGSEKDFPPLDPQLNMNSWLDMLDELDSSGEFLEDSSSSSTMDHSFQEALCGEKRIRPTTKMVSTMLC